ncbi:hypothetical protein V22_29470 [Calycomorphotria hydatis]|uniref:Uncharacterized protein n=1 Tax=Calycomorphotria hydatis TaxID=2528027 RepID=A0A517TBE6_9PLAN|nr:hypothetical protein V22_29470 [Calycomorphotria hydatis]
MTLVTQRHSRESENPIQTLIRLEMDSRFRGNDGNECKLTNRTLSHINLEPRQEFLSRLQNP